MLYLTCTMISSVDLAHYGVSCVKDFPGSLITLTAELDILLIKYSILKTATAEIDIMTLLMTGYDVQSYLLICL